MRFSLDWLRDFIEIDIPLDRLAERLTMAGFAVESAESFVSPSDPDRRADTVLEVEVTSNRPDAMNHLGLAREISAIFGLPLRASAVTLVEDPLPAPRAVSVTIEAHDLCPRYVGRVVSGIRIVESPAWLKRRIEAAGLDPKNNIVDASNYVLLELGQPLHTFDLARLPGRGVVVRRASPGERIVTVTDRVERSLAGGMLVIAETGEPGRPGRPAAIAGVMGGLASAISGSTTDVFIESAWFEPLSVRRTARALDLHTDASHRFERGADPAMTRFAADRLAALIVEIAGGRALGGPIDVRSEGSGSRPAFEPPLAAAPPGGKRSFPLLYRLTPIVLTDRRLSGLLGLDASPNKVPETLGRLGIEVAGRPGDPVEERPAEWLCYAPSWRFDLTREVDLIEEYARITGYDRIPETLPASAGPLSRPGAEVAEDRARDLLVSFGYNEAINYAMVSAADDALFGPWDSIEGGPRGAGVPRAEPDEPPGNPYDERLVIANPLSERWEVMRRSLLAPLARTLTFNIAHGRLNLRVFEVATVHRKDGQGRAIESRAVAIGGSGLAADPAWPVPARPFDVLDLKGALEALAAGIRGELSPPSLLAGSRGGPAFDPPGDSLPLDLEPNGLRKGTWPFHPGQSFTIRIDGRLTGRGGRLHPDAEAALECDRPLLLAEMLLEPLAHGHGALRFEPLPRLNPVERDLSFLVAKDLAFAEILAAVRTAVTTLGTSDADRPVFFLVDRFEGGSLPPGKISYALRFRFSPRERPLTADELNGAVERIGESLVENLSAEIRSK